MPRMQQILNADESLPEGNDSSKHWLLQDFRTKTKNAVFFFCIIVPVTATLYVCVSVYGVCISSGVANLVCSALLDLPWPITWGRWLLFNSCAVGSS